MQPVGTFKNMLDPAWVELGHKKVVFGKKYPGRVKGLFFFKKGTEFFLRSNDVKEVLEKVAYRVFGDWQSKGFSVKRLVSQARKAPI
jgi:hypothetical protein